MKTWCFAIMCAFAASAFAIPMPSAGHTLVPAEIQQIIGVDYRAIKDSPTAQALKQQLIPDNIKQAEQDLKRIGIDTDRDVGQLTVVTFRSGKKNTLQTIFLADGSFSAKAVLKKMKLKKIAPTKYGASLIYPMSGGMDMVFLDDNTVAFGDSASLHSGLDARDGKRSTLDSNTQVSEMMAAVDGAPVWSVLDQQGTQTMMHSALGQAAGLADYDQVKKRLLGSRYTMNFQSGVDFNLNVQTSDSMSAATLSTLVKGDILYRKMNASAVEKSVLESTTADSDGSNFKLHFKADDQKFQTFLHSDLFAAVSH